MTIFKPKTILVICLLLLLIVIATTPVAQSHQLKSYSDPTLNITTATNKESYYLREMVRIEGNLTLDGSPVQDSLVAIEVCDSSRLPVTFRTQPTGEIPVTNWPINFVEVYPCDSHGDPKYTFVVGQTLWIGLTIKNYGYLPYEILATVSLCDGNNIPLGAWYPISTTIEPDGTLGPLVFMAMRIPAWAYPGNATIFASVFSDFPQDSGIPYCPEKTICFEIKRNPEMTYSTEPSTSPPIVHGTYTSFFRLPPGAKPGYYNIYVSASGGTATVKNTTPFFVESTEAPPQASFTYSPLKPYVNMTITFDASASTAEGYNDTIISYEWNFGDGTPEVVETEPTTTHIFEQVDTYIVTLNVTDSEGLWSTTSKPIGILPPEGPTADFIWYPSTPIVNQSVTFDAAYSTLGWNGTAHPPIISYEWNFGDGNITGGNYATITHTYLTEGDYTVTLAITDSEGLQDNVTKLVMVRLSGLIGDVNGDGIVDMTDIGLVAMAYGSYEGDPLYEPRLDLNSDGIVDMTDLGMVAQNYGKTAV